MKLTQDKHTSICVTVRCVVMAASLIRAFCSAVFKPVIPRVQNSSKTDDFSRTPVWVLQDK